MSIHQDTAFGNRKHKTRNTCTKKSNVWSKNRGNPMGLLGSRPQYCRFEAGCSAGIQSLINQPLVGDALAFPPSWFGEAIPTGSHKQRDCPTCKSQADLKCMNELVSIFHLGVCFFKHWNGEVLEHMNVTFRADTTDWQRRQLQMIDFVVD